MVRAACQNSMHEQMMKKEMDFLKRSSSTTTTPKKKDTWKRLNRCENCAGCLIRNCGRCVSCLDMPMYGGEGKLKTACDKRICDNHLRREVERIDTKLSTLKGEAKRRPLIHQVRILMNLHLRRIQCLCDSDKCSICNIYLKALKHGQNECALTLLQFSKG